jgi:hypothetical protein
MVAARQAPTVLAPTYYNSVTDAAAAHPIVVAAGQTVDEIVIKVLEAAAYQITGTVVDGSGAPVANALVAMTVDGQAGSGLPFFQPGRARTDAKGAFTITNVINGTYLIGAAAGIVSQAPPGAPNVMSGTIGGSIAGGITSGSFTMTETAGGIRTQYRLEENDRVRITIHDGSIIGLRLVAAKRD